MELAGLSRAELERLITDAENELERRTQVWEVEQRFAWVVGELGRLAAVQGPVPVSPVPEGGFLPGQIVTPDDGETLYQNMSGQFVHVAPGDPAPDVWEEIVEAPEPDPDPEPDPNEPEYEPWGQPGGGQEYELGAIVTHNGHIWENTIDRNGWEPGTPHSQWTDLGPVDNQ